MANCIIQAIYMISIGVKVLYALHILNFELNVSHNDMLGMSNVLITQTNDECLEYPWIAADGKKTNLVIPTFGYRAMITDFASSSDYDADPNLINGSSAVKSIFDGDDTSLALSWIYNDLYQEREVEETTLHKAAM